MKMINCPKKNLFRSCDTQIKESEASIKLNINSFCRTGQFVWMGMKEMILFVIHVCADTKHHLSISFVWASIDFHYQRFFFFFCWRNNFVTCVAAHHQARFDDNPASRIDWIFCTHKRANSAGGLASHSHLIQSENITIWFNDKTLISYHNSGSLVVCLPVSISLSRSSSHVYKPIFEVFTQCHDVSLSAQMKIDSYLSLVLLSMWFNIYILVWKRIWSADILSQLLTGNQCSPYGKNRRESLQTSNDNENGKNEIFLVNIFQRGRNFSAAVKLSLPSVRLLIFERQQRDGQHVVYMWRLVNQQLNTTTISPEIECRERKKWLNLWYSR